jgi:hypothetical protein
VILPPGAQKCPAIGGKFMSSLMNMSTKCKEFTKTFFLRIRYNVQNIESNDTNVTEEKGKTMFTSIAVKISKRNSDIQLV